MNFFILKREGLLSLNSMCLLIVQGSCQSRRFGLRMRANSNDVAVRMEKPGLGSHGCLQQGQALQRL